MISDVEKRRLDAAARASEAFIAVDIIQRYRGCLRDLMANHDVRKGDNAVRRDCEAFHERLKELGLTRTVATILSGK